VKVLLGAFGDHLIRVSRQHGENFHAVRGREMRSTGARRDLSLAGSAACAQVF